MPTEAEWEYACRAGTETKYNTGNSESDLARAGWYSKNSGNKTHPVGQKAPNSWGLYDMHGNLWEWCNDWYDLDYYNSSPSVEPTGPYSGSNRVKRGGGYGHEASFARSAIRSGNGPILLSSHVGFRIVRRSFLPEPAMYTISGTVTGASEVTATLSGDTSDSQTVNSGGSYSFTVEHGGNYTVTPSKSGYSFLPANQTFSDVTANQTQDFSGNAIDSNSKIAFSSSRDGNYEIYVMDADGSNQINLTNKSANKNMWPSWSPDGSKISFHSERDTAGIYVMDADGSNQTKLTNNINEFFTSWSPDSSKIAFAANRDGSWDIYVMDADGSNQTRLTNNSATDWDPSWSPF